MAYFFKAQLKECNNVFVLCIKEHVFIHVYCDILTIETLGMLTYWYWPVSNIEDAWLLSGMLFDMDVEQLCLLPAGGPSRGRSYTVFS